MGDSGEGLIDNEARIQERIEELQRERAQSSKPPVKNPELARRLESLQLARKELSRSLEGATHEARRSQLKAALAEIDRQIAAAEAALS
jgi:chromosome segregation ATPase